LDSVFQIGYLLLLPVQENSAKKKLRAIKVMRWEVFSMMFATIGSKESGGRRLPKQLQIFQINPFSNLK